MQVGERNSLLVRDYFQTYFTTKSADLHKGWCFSLHTIGSCNVNLSLNNTFVPQLLLKGLSCPTIWLLGLRNETRLLTSTLWIWYGFMGLLDQTKALLSPIWIFRSSMGIYWNVMWSKCFNAIDWSRCEITVPNYKSMFPPSTSSTLANATGLISITSDHDLTLVSWSKFTVNQSRSVKTATLMVSLFSFSITDNSTMECSFINFYSLFSWKKTIICQYST